MAGRRRARGRVARPVRLWRWFRVLPVAALVLTLAVCGALAAFSTTLLRPVFYPVEHAEAIVAASERHGVDPALTCAVIKCESSWDAEALSSAGAVGLMQLMPQTARDLAEMGLVDPGAYDPADLTNAETNIEYGCAYLGYLQGQLSSLDEIVAAYNAGLGSVQGWILSGGSIPDGIEYAETRAYLERVRLAYEGYQRSYPAGLAVAAAA